MFDRACVLSIVITEAFILGDVIAFKQWDHSTSFCVYAFVSNIKYCHIVIHHFWLLKSAMYSQIRNASLSTVCPGNPSILLSSGLCLVSNDSRIQFQKYIFLSCNQKYICLPCKHCVLVQNQHWNGHILQILQ